MSAPNTQTKIVDDYSLAARPGLFCFANTGLGIGTVFFWQVEAQTYLITNWHNVSGLNPATGNAMRRDLGRPTRVEVPLFRQEGSVDITVESFRLYSDDGAPLWFVHPQHKQLVDVVALPVTLPTPAVAWPINELTARNDMKLKVGHDLFVIGFPFSQSIFDWGMMPIWKRASLASEPDWVLGSQQYMLVDTASRPGMSGSPVIRRAFSGAELENGSTTLSGGTRFVGVYAGRLAAQDPNDAQLGRVFGRSLVEEVLSGQSRDTLDMPPEPKFEQELVSLKGYDPNVITRL